MLIVADLSGCILKKKMDWSKWNKEEMAAAIEPFTSSGVYAKSLISFREYYFKYNLCKYISDRRPG
jgi:sulfur relay (sulfurtransferase) DsrC/TusE family protein